MSAFDQWLSTRLPGAAGGKPRRQGPGGGSRRAPDPMEVIATLGAVGAFGGPGPRPGESAPAFDPSLIAGPALPPARTYDPALIAGPALPTEHAKDEFAAAAALAVVSDWHKNDPRGGPGPRWIDSTPVPIPSRRYDPALIADPPVPAPSADDLTGADNLAAVTGTDPGELPTAAEPGSPEEQAGVAKMLADARQRLQQRAILNTVPGPGPTARQVRDAPPTGDTGLLNRAGGLAGSLTGAVTTPIMDNVVDPVKDKVSAVTGAVTGKAGDIYGGVETAAGKAGDIYGGVETAAGTAADVYDRAKHLPREVYEPVTSFTGGAWDVGKHVPRDAWNIARQVPRTSYDSALHPFDTVKEASRGVHAGYNKAFEILQYGMEQVEDAFGEGAYQVAMGNVKGDNETVSFHDIWSNKAGALLKLNEAFGKYTPAVIVNFFAPLGADLADWAKDPANKAIIEEAYTLGPIIYKDDGTPQTDPATGQVLRGPKGPEGVTQAYKNSLGGGTRGFAKRQLYDLFMDPLTYTIVIPELTAGLKALTYVDDASRGVKAGVIGLRNIGRAAEFFNGLQDAPLTIPLKIGGKVIDNRATRAALRGYLATDAGAYAQDAARTAGGYVARTAAPVTGPIKTGVSATKSFFTDLTNEAQERLAQSRVGRDMWGLSEGEGIREAGPPLRDPLQGPTQPGGGPTPGQQPLPPNLSPGQQQLGLPGGLNPNAGPNAGPGGAPGGAPGGGPGPGGAPGAGPVPGSGASVVPGSPIQPPRTPTQPWTAAEIQRTEHLGYNAAAAEATRRNLVMEHQALTRRAAAAAQPTAPLWPATQPTIPGLPGQRVQPSLGADPTALAPPAPTDLFADTALTAPIPSAETLTQGLPGTEATPPGDPLTGATALTGRPIQGVDASRLRIVQGPGGFDVTNERGVPLGPPSPTREAAQERADAMVTGLISTIADDDTDLLDVVRPQLFGNRIIDDVAYVPRAQAGMAQEFWGAYRGPAQTSVAEQRRLRAAANQSLGIARTNLLAQEAIERMRLVTETEAPLYTRIFGEPAKPAPLNETATQFMVETLGNNPIPDDATIDAASARVNALAGKVSEEGVPDIIAGIVQVALGPDQLQAKVIRQVLQKRNRGTWSDDLAKVLKRERERLYPGEVDRSIAQLGNAQPPKPGATATTPSTTPAVIQPGAQGADQTADLAVVPKVMGDGRKVIYVGRTADDTPVRIVERTPQARGAGTGENLYRDSVGAENRYDLEYLDPDTSGWLRSDVALLRGLTGLGDMNDLMGAARATLDTVEGARARGGQQWIGDRIGRRAPGEFAPTDPHAAAADLDRRIDEAEVNRRYENGEDPEDIRRDFARQGREFPDIFSFPNAVEATPASPSGAGLPGVADRPPAEATGATPGIPSEPIPAGAGPGAQTEPITTGAAETVTPTNRTPKGIVLEKRAVPQNVRDDSLSRTGLVNYVGAEHTDQGYWILEQESTNTDPRKRPKKSWRVVPETPEGGADIRDRVTATKTYRTPEEARAALDTAVARKTPAAGSEAGTRTAATTPATPGPLYVVRPSETDPGRFTIVDTRSGAVVVGGGFADTLDDIQKVADTLNRKPIPRAETSIEMARPGEVADTVGRETPAPLAGDVAVATPSAPYRIERGVKDDRGQTWQIVDAPTGAIITGDFISQNAALTMLKRMVEDPDMVRRMEEGNARLLASAQARVTQAPGTALPTGNLPATPPETVRTALGDQAVLPGSADARRPTFGAEPSAPGALTAPPQSTAPLLDLQPQVIGSAGEREAQRLAGQKDMFGNDIELDTTFGAGTPEQQTRARNVEAFREGMTPPEPPVSEITPTAPEPPRQWSRDGAPDIVALNRDDHPLMRHYREGMSAGFKGYEYDRLPSIQNLTEHKVRSGRGDALTDADAYDIGLVEGHRQRFELGEDPTVELTPHQPTDVEQLMEREAGETPAPSAPIGSDIIPEPPTPGAITATQAPENAASAASLESPVPSTTPESGRDAIRAAAANIRAMGEKNRAQARGVPGREADLAKAERDIADAARMEADLAAESAPSSPPTEPGLRASTREELIAERKAQEAAAPPIPGPGATPAEIIATKPVTVGDYRVEPDPLTWAKTRTWRILDTRTDEVVRDNLPTRVSGTRAADDLRLGIGAPTLAEAGSDATFADEVAQARPTTPTNAGAGGTRRSTLAEEMGEDELPVESITTEDAMQPREGLDRAHVEHLKANLDLTQLDRPVVWRNPETGTWVIVGGHHRFQALKELGYRDIPVRKLPEGTTREEAKKLGRHSNDKSLAMSPMAKGRTIRADFDEGQTIDQIKADRPGLGSKKTIEDHLNVTYLPGEMQTTLTATSSNELLAKFSIMGKAVRDGVTDETEIGQLWHNLYKGGTSPTTGKVLPVMDSTAIRESLTQRINDKINRNITTPGLFPEGTDLGSSTIYESHRAMTELRTKEKDLLDQAKVYQRAAEGTFTDKDLSDRLLATRAQVQSEIRTLRESLGLDPTKDSVTGKIDLPALGTAEPPTTKGKGARAKRSPQSVGFLDPRSLSIWDLQDRVGEAVASGARTVRDAVTNVANASVNLPGARSAPQVEGAGRFAEDASIEGPMAISTADDLIQRAYDHGRIGQEAHARLTEVRTFKDPAGGKTTVDRRIGDVFIDNLSQGMAVPDAIEATLAALWKAPNPHEKNFLYRALRNVAKVYMGLTTIARENLLYGPSGAVRSISSDLFGDSIMHAIQGRPLTALKGFNPRKNWTMYRNVRKDTVDLLTTDETGKIVQGIGLAAPVEGGLEHGGYGRAGDLTGGEMALHRFVERATGWHRAGALTGVLASEQVKDFRTAADLVRRWNLYGDALKKELPGLRNDFAELVSTRLGTTDGDRLLRGLNDIFDDRDIRRIGADLGLDPGQMEFLARSWRSGVDKLDAHAMKDLKKIGFDMSPTRADEAMKSMFLFHTWQTRAIPAYARSFIKNPVLAANWYRMNQDLEKQCGGRPASTCGFLKIWNSPVGFSMLGAPQSLLTSALMDFDPDHWDDPTKSTIDKLLDKTKHIGMVNPILRGILYATALSDEPATDPLGISRTWNTVRAGIDYGRSRGVFGPEFGARLTPDYYKQVLNKFYGAARDWVKANPQPHPAGIDPLARDDESVQARARDLIYAHYNIPPGTDPATLTGQAAVELNTAGQAWQDHTPNTWNAQAYRDYLSIRGGKLGKVITGNIIPGPTSLRIDSQDTATVQRDESRAVLDAAPAGSPRSEAAEQQNRATTNFINLARAGTANEVASNFEPGFINAAITDPTAKAAYDISSTIRNGRAPAGSSVASTDAITISGRSFTLAELAALPDSTRATYAKLWAIEHGVQPLIAVAKAQRDAARVQYPQEGGYLRWLDDADAMGSPELFIDQVAANHPEYAAFLASQSDETKADPERFVGIALGRDAYLHYLGQKTGVYDEAPLDAVDPTKEGYHPSPPQSGGSGDFPDKSPGESFLDDYERYYADKAKFNQALAQYTGNPNANWDSFDPNVQWALQTHLAEAGVTIPQEPQSLAIYRQWASVQPRGADTSIVTYVEWLEKVYAGAGPAAEAQITSALIGQLPYSAQQIAATSGQAPDQGFGPVAGYDYGAGDPFADIGFGQSAGYDPRNPFAGTPLGRGYDGKDPFADIGFGQR